MKDVLLKPVEQFYVSQVLPWEGRSCSSRSLTHEGWSPWHQCGKTAVCCSWKLFHCLKFSVNESHAKPYWRCYVALGLLIPVQHLGVCFSCDSDKWSLADSEKIMLWKRGLFPKMKKLCENSILWSQDSPAIAFVTQVYSLLHRSTDCWRLPCLCQC